MVFRLSDSAFLAFWASCGSVWFIRQQGSAAPVSQPSTTVEGLPSFNECSYNKSEHGVTSTAQKRRVQRLPGLTSRLVCVGFRRVWSMLHWGFETLFAGPLQPTRRQSHRYTNRDCIRDGALRSQTCVTCCSVDAGRGVYEERLGVWPILGDRRILASPDGTLVYVPIDHLVARRDVTGKQTYPREAQQIGQYELPVSDDDLRNWVRQGQVISSREDLYESICQPDSGFDWEGQSLLLQDASVRAAFVGTWEKLLLFRSFPLNRCVEASTEPLRAVPLEGIDGSLSWGECWVVAALSHLAFGSARDFTARAAMLGGHAVDVVEGLTVRMQRFRAREFSFCRHFRSCSFVSQFVGCGGGMVWRAPSCQYHQFSG